MIYCLNPHCRDRLNPDGYKFCQSCGFQLILKNRYHVLKFLGSGGFGRTYLAVDQDCMNLPCVVKQFSPSPDIQAEPVALHKATDMFYQEAVRLLQLGEHPQIPRLLAYFEQEKHLYLVQELIDGQDLRQELATEGGFSEQKISQLLADMLPVLKFIHDHGVIHRDIKPGNIMRRHKDGRFVLIDFGVSKMATGTLLGKVGTKVGTAGFTPLEQMRGQAYPASDLYSLGVTCVCLLMQRFPEGDGFDEAYDPMEGRWKWREHLPEGITINPQLGEILDKLLQDLPKNRYQSADEVLQDLKAVKGSGHQSFSLSVSGRSISEQAGRSPERVGNSETANSTVSVQPSPTADFANVAETNVSASAVEPNPLSNLVDPSPPTPHSPSPIIPRGGTDFPNPELTSPPDLISTIGVDYSRLCQLLAVGKWKEADLETTIILLRASGREQEGWMRTEDFKKFPCQDLHLIDRAWVEYSNGRFGFSIQKQIWDSVGARSTIDYVTWCHFGDRVGWRVKGNWLNYCDLTFDPKAAPLGHLPAGGLDSIVLGRWDLVCSSIAARIVECNIQ
ncbi:MAG TPA: serine/threonine-protein kinase [Coleofasciculaceae cyanobacterium]|jgi:serine/threonine protein kinase